MRFIVTYNLNDKEKIRLFKTFLEAQGFISKTKKAVPNSFNFKIKVIKY